MKKDKLTELDKFHSREAAEQTTLSRIQTGLTLIGLGFGIASVVVFMEAHHEQQFLITMIKAVGILLILTGFVSTISSLFQHRSKIKNIGHKDDFYSGKFNVSLFLGIMISLFGIIAFLAILIHMLL